MAVKEIVQISVDQLRQYINTHHEKEYIIIDVRQPEEYDTGHIPGVRLIPFPSIAKYFGSLPQDIDIIFTCKSGARSSAAAAIARDLKKTGKIYNLTGGILAWNGKTLKDLPKVQVLKTKGEFEDMLSAAIELEKGAWNFYSTLLKKFPDEPFSNKMKALILAESEHARTLYDILRQKQDLPEFDSYFKGVSGDILEGGMTVHDAYTAIDRSSPAHPIAILDLALDIEYSAFELYRSGADMVNLPEMKTILLEIANGEKQHMKTLADAFSYLNNRQ